MKTFALVPFTILATAIVGFGQGPLTPPPGAPAPVMKSLDQVEARTPLVAGQTGVAINANGSITISQPGSYYLTKNLTITAAGADGITVAASFVTLDLNGFSLINVTGNGSNAVVIAGGNVTVRNGTIRGGSTWAGSVFTPAGWDEGITTNSNYPNMVAENISVFGTRDTGISLYYEGSRIEHCSVHTTGGNGLYASSISFSTARKIGGTAISASTAPDSGSVSNCFGEAVSPSGYGIYAPDAAVSNSKGLAVGGAGISARTAENCSGTSVSDVGLVATAANNCRGLSTSGIGINSTICTNCHGQSISGSYGILATLATSSVGSRPNGVAISANSVNGCYAVGGTITTSNKYNTP
ncbi:MAG TPA: hypothetical protein VGE67_04590 [Haloferula sp.]